MNRFALGVLLLSAFMTALAQETHQQYPEYGELLFIRLSSAPFPHPRRASGHVYGNQQFPAEKHYSDSSVAIFIPNGFRQTDAVDIIVHLHGWWNNIDTVLKRYKLPQQVFESGKNAILVVPEGPRNAPDSFGGKFEDPGGFKRFVDDVGAFLVQKGKIKTTALGKVILTGHSGAYHGISFTLLRGGIPEKISEVYLFDALYGQTEKYAYWIDHFKGKMVAVYTDSGGTKDETESLMEDLRGWGIPYCAKDEAALLRVDLLNNQLVFIHSALEHDMVLHGRMQFREYLKASGLGNR
ncbi:MAG: hypothetical protein NTU47_01095 [Ignavibacteriales bacterium]|nr:hypothetical protein [Ignavibacteriales bacterium]